MGKFNGVTKVLLTNLSLKSPLFDLQMLCYNRGFKYADEIEYIQMKRTSSHKTVREERWSL